MKEDDINEENNIEDENLIDTNENKKENSSELISLQDKVKKEDENSENKNQIQLEVNEDDNEKSPKKNNKNFTPFEKDPYLDSNIISRFFMYWAYKIIRISTRTEMKKEYLGKIGEKHDSKHFNDDISYIWDTKGYKNIKKYALILCVFRANIKMILLVFFLTLIKAGTNYLSIILIKIFIDSFDENAEKTNFMYKLPLWALGLIFVSSQLLGGILDVQNSMLQGIFGNKAQFQLSVFIYHKILKCSQSSFTERATEGQIINFVQFDTGKFNWMLIRSPSLLLHPIQIIAYSYLVYAFFGNAFLPGIGVILIFCFLGYITSRKYHKY